MCVCVICIQVEQGEGTAVLVPFGAHTYASHVHKLSASLPGPGEYILDVYVSVHNLTYTNADTHTR